MPWQKVERITDYQMQNRFESAFNAVSGVLTEEEFIIWYNEKIVPLLDTPKKAMFAAEQKASEVVSWWLTPKN